ncbi:MAG TPA: rhodanese-like domain-containing protein [Candidatus Fimivivens sp.]|nr:rhodanese-like domain-containing protein [Candidatus Fimivivens sp.]
MNTTTETRMTSKQDSIAMLIGFGLVVIVLGFFAIKGSVTRQVTGSTGDDTRSASEKRSLPSLSVSDLRSMLTAGTPVIVADLRSDSEFALSHAAGSIDIASPDQLAGLDVPEGGTVLLVSSGDASKDEGASEALSKKEVPYAFVADDLGGWIQAGGSVITAPNSSSPIDRSKVTFIDAATWKSLISQGEISYYPVDIRSSETSGKDRITGALNIPYHEIEKRRGELPVASNILLCADTADDAFNGAVHLFDLGFFSVRTLKGACSDIR